MLSLLKAHASEGKISWKKFEKELQNEPDSYKFLIAWSKKVQAYTAFDKFFQSTGHVYMYWFSRLILIAAIVYYILITGFFPSKVFPLTSKICVLTASIGIYGFIMTKFSNTFITVFGRWTPEGNLYYKHWNNFKKYITDLSALKNTLLNQLRSGIPILYMLSLSGHEMLQNISQIVPRAVKKEPFHP